MKKLTSVILLALVSSSFLIAGGLITNTNQSAAWARTLSRNATLGVDAVYFNPAGLGTFKNGLHLSLSNQSIFQTRSISSDYMYLSDAPKTYEAELVAPLFPSIYAAYKLDKWAFSAGFNIIGGGGSADYETGLPSFEIPVGSLVPMLQGSLLPIDQGVEGAIGVNPGFANISGYNMDASFSGASTYYGIQVGATYAINDMISVAIGGRYVMVNNSYEGSLEGVTIDAPEVYGGTQTPGNYLRTVATTPYVSGDPVTVATLNGTATLLDAATADAALNTVQKGSGFAPIVGINIHLTDMINIAAKYEHRTKIELTNDTEATNIDLYPDGETVRADLPGMFTLGASVSPIKKLTASVGFDYFLDIPAYYGKVDEDGEPINNETTIDQNAYTIHASLEYKLLGILGLSAGFSTGNLGVNDDYQSDLNHALKSSSIAGGVFVDVGELLTVNAGFVHVMYDDYTKAQSYTPMGFPQAVPFSDTYSKATNLFAIGVDIRL